MGFIFTILLLAFLGYLFYGNVIWPMQEAAKKREAQKAEDARRAREIADEQRFYKDAKKGNDRDAVRFYNLCVSQGIRNVAKDSDRARLDLFIKNKGFEGTADELVAVFKKGQRL